MKKTDAEGMLNALKEANIENIEISELGLMLKFVIIARRGKLPEASIREQIAARLLDAVSPCGDNLMSLDAHLREGFFYLMKALAGPFQTDAIKEDIYGLLI